jgi:cobalt/nickel transport system permease protein
LSSTAALGESSMTLLLDIPEAQPSPLQRLDPRWKLAALLGPAFGVAFLQSPGPALAALAGALLLVVVARLPTQWFLTRLGAALLVPAFFALSLPFVLRPDAEWSFSVAGLERGVALIAKCGCVVSLMLVLLATAPLHDTFKAAQSLRVPGWLVQLALLSYRYVALLAEEFGRLRTALRVRGYRNRASMHSYRTVGQVVGTLLVRGHERSERVAQAMRCRAFDGRFHSLHDFTTRGLDVLFLSVTVAATAALLVWDRW